MGCRLLGLQAAFRQGLRHFSYDLADIGRYSTVSTSTLTAHFDAVQPGASARGCIYEDKWWADTGGADAPAVSRPLGPRLRTGVPEDSTSSAPGRPHGQFRTGPPALFREGLDQWRNFEPWLGDLKAELDDAAAWS